MNIIRSNRAHALADHRSTSVIQRHRSRHGCPSFTLIELLVVVGIIAILSGIILPALAKAKDHARRMAALEAAARTPRTATATEIPALPKGLRPYIDSLDLQMKLVPSYHRLGMDIFTHYQVDCSGRIVFRHPGGTDDEHVMLMIPFPDNIVEARDVQLKLLSSDGEDLSKLAQFIYDRRGIFCLCPMVPGRPQTAEVSFTALGRERFDFALPPARLLRDISVDLNLSGSKAHYVPDESLQPTVTSGDLLNWSYKNLVSDREITVMIPGAQSPLARVLLLFRLMAVAILLFGAGFWFLSEQVQPGRLDSFRFGHFLLLAITYSLFFGIFTLLEFHGRLGTPTAMVVSAVFSLPLLALHVSRVLDWKFALTRVAPLTLFTLGLVINGVYGGAMRDYVFVGAAIIIIGYITIIYPTWTANRQQYQKELAARPKPAATNSKTSQPAAKGEIHCVACGHMAPEAPYCSQCGAARPLKVQCTGCGHTLTLPVHVLPAGWQKKDLFCPQCGQGIHRRIGDTPDIPRGPATVG